MDNKYNVVIIGSWTKLVGGYQEVITTKLLEANRTAKRPQIGFIRRNEVEIMEEESRRFAGWLIIILPTVIYGGVSILGFLVDTQSGYVDNPLRQDFFRAGHAHAGILLILSLVTLKYVDETALSKGLKSFVRSSIPLSAIFLPAAFFFSVLSPEATEPNGFIYLAYVGAVLLALGLLVLGIGLVRKRQD